MGSLFNSRKKKSTGILNDICKVFYKEKILDIKCEIKSGGEKHNKQIVTN